MDDTCAVCAEVLEWVAYGACGHRDVCSTCVARLRFICDDRRCCICKSESSFIFVTKALGDYTRTITDFSLLAPEPREGRVGSYWYHEDTQAFFDDVDQYKMIKAMCRLSCSVCDKAEQDGPPGGDGPKRRPARFRKIEQLKGHLFHKHRVIMCSLCLEGRKVFICEQKLYTRSQLNQHISTGDSEVDGSESERGGFTGHPVCEFCKTSFYGDNELYTHMSTEHYTCHMCQRQHPGQYEYYKNYDDLELHFRRDHFLCEDEACLAKKFIVFSTEAEMKRHNTLEHGGRMSRAKRNAALQIPTSFRYRRSSEQDHRRGRNRTFLRDESDNQLSMAIEASLGTAHFEALTRGPSTSSNGQVASDHRTMDNIDPLESLTAFDSETSSRYLEALGQNCRNSSLQESSFPPLPFASSSSQQFVGNDALPLNTMASHLRKKNNRKVTVLGSAPAWPAASQALVSHSSRPDRGAVSSASGPAQSGYPSLAQAQGWPTSVNGHLSSASPVNLGSNRTSHSQSASNLAATGSSQPAISDFPLVSAAKVRKTPVAATGASQTAISDFSPVSATQVERTPVSAAGASQPAISEFPPVSAAQVQRTPVANQVLPVMEDVHTANKSLVERLRSALEYDEDKYTSFKDLSAQYRQGLIDTAKYFDCVQQYGLSHLVLELARLCPDAQKQRELVETHNARMKSNDWQENGGPQGNVQVKGSITTKKGKTSNAEASSSRDRLADNVINTVRTLQSQFKPQEEEVEVLSRDGYRALKGKSNVISDELQTESSEQRASASTENVAKHDRKGDGGGGRKQKKTSKFDRVRLGDGSAAALLDLRKSDLEPDPDPVDNRLDDVSGPGAGLPVCGVWRKGGVQRLFS